jgi:methyl-accepting chemotaxis protein
MKMGLNLNVSKKIFFQGLAIILCFVLVQIGVVFSVKSSLKKGKIESIDNPSDVAFSLLAEYDERAKKGEFSQEEAQKRARMRLEKLRYGENHNEYFWVNDLEGKLLMHGFKPEMTGKSLLEDKDPTGKRYMAEMVAVCKDKGEGIVEYQWAKPGSSSPVSKIAYVRLFKPWNWIMGTGIYLDDVSSQINKILYTILGITLIIALGGLAVAFLTTRSITRPLNRGVAFAGRMAEGDLTQTLDSSQKDEIGVLSRALSQMGQSLRQMIKNISANVETLASSSTELTAISKLMSGSAEQTSLRANMVSSAVEQMSSNMNAVAASMEQTSTNINIVATSAEEMTSTIGEIARNSEKARAITAGAVEQVNGATQKVSELGQAARDIGKVTETISAISAQTNLLALNATIEAARAGAAGKGFAVVANEIKELAQQTASATEDIKTRIEGIQSSTSLTVTDIDQISRVIQEVNEIVSTIAAAIEEQSVVTKDIANNVAQAAQGVEEVNRNVSQTSTAAGTVAQEIVEVNQASGEISSSSAQVLLSSEELSRLAEQLRNLTAQFKI